VTKLGRYQNNDRLHSENRTLAAGQICVGEIWATKRDGMIQPPNGLQGPFSLTPRGIDSAVNVLLPGVFVLGKVKDDDGIFQIRFVGRDDQDLRSSLRQHVADWYPQFFFKVYFSGKEAFEKECELYHKFNPPDNTAHPARNKDTGWTCPCCGFSG
jgi:hypothetical protein